MSTLPQPPCDATTFTPQRTPADNGCCEEGLGITASCWRGPGDIAAWPAPPSGEGRQ